MDFRPSPISQQYAEQVAAFISAEIEPWEAECRHAADAGDDTALELIDGLKDRARQAGLWNLFMPDSRYGPGLSNVEYAPIAELTGRCPIAPEVFNCNAPDTGNMEVLLHYGSPEQQRRWMIPLLDGRIRSAFCMTEPDVASSDATNMRATATIDGDEVVLDGRKWFSTGVGHPRCEVLIFMGLTRPDADRHAQHSMVLVPRHAPGVTVRRMLPVMGRHDAPYGHGEVMFDQVRLPTEMIVAGPGRGFEIAQGRLGPGRIHHCMRLIGLAEKALELACERALARTAFGKPLANLGGNRERIAEARIAINQTRLLVLHTAWLLDTEGVAGALSEVSQIKVATPAMAEQVIDLAIQLHGAAGLTEDFPLAAAWTAARALRLADGPDEVHRGVVARAELAAHSRSRDPGARR